MNGGKFALQNRLGQLVVERKFTIFALFYFEFEGKFQVQTPRGAYIWKGDLTITILAGLYLEGLIHGGAYFRNFTVCHVDIAAVQVNSEVITCLVPRRLSLNENVRAKEGRTETTGFARRLHPSHGPLRFFTSHSRFALASTTRKTKRLRRRLGHY